MTSNAREAAQRFRLALIKKRRLGLFFLLLSLSYECTSGLAPQSFLHADYEYYARLCVVSSPSLEEDKDLHFLALTM